MLNDRAEGFLATVTRRLKSAQELQTTGEEQINNANITPPTTFIYPSRRSCVDVLSSCLELRLTLV